MYRLDDGWKIVIDFASIVPSNVLLSQTVKGRSQEDKSDVKVLCLGKHSFLREC